MTDRRSPDFFSAASSRGIRWELAVLAFMSNLLNLEVLPGDEFVRHREWDSGVRQQANFDGIILSVPGVEGRCIAEAKTTANNTSTAELYREGELPLAHFLQVQMYLDCAESQSAFVGCLIGPQDPDKWQGDNVEGHVVQVLPCRQTQLILRRATAAFWRYVVADLRPTWTTDPQDRGRDVARLRADPRNYIKCCGSPLSPTRGI